MQTPPLINAAHISVCERHVWGANSITVWW